MGVARRVAVNRVIKELLQATAVVNPAGRLRQKVSASVFPPIVEPFAPDRCHSPR
jgi:hypothetical protein